jgi:hypothetical protein
LTCKRCTNVKGENKGEDKRRRWKNMEPKEYIEWLNKQRDRKDSLGDLVRKFLTIDTYKNVKSWYGFKHHLEQQRATEAEIMTCEKSWVEYTTRKGKTGLKN